MAEFVVKVADDRGRVQQHIEQGYSEAEVRDRFSQQGYLVYWVKPQGMLNSGVALRRRRKLKQSTFLIFNQQFLTLIRAGLPILNSLELLIKRQKDPQLRQILENVRDRVKGGELLSDAFAAQGIVPKIYTTTLMAGEKSGNIDEVLTRYIGFQRLAMTFRKKLFVSSDLSHSADHGGHDHGDVPVHLRCAQICRPVQQSGSEAAGDHRVHAGRWGRTRRNMLRMFS